MIGPIARVRAVFVDETDVARRLDGLTEGALEICRLAGATGENAELERTAGLTGDRRVVHGPFAALYGPIIGAVVVNSSGECGGRVEEQAVGACLVSERSVGTFEIAVTRVGVLVDLKAFGDGASAGYGVSGDGNGSLSDRTRSSADSNHALGFDCRENEKDSNKRLLHRRALFCRPLLEMTTRLKSRLLVRRL